MWGSKYIPAAAVDAASLTFISASLYMEDDLIINPSNIWKLTPGFSGFSCGEYNTVTYNIMQHTFKVNVLLAWSCGYITKNIVVMFYHNIYVSVYLIDINVILFLIFLEENTIFM